MKKTKRTYWASTILMVLTGALTATLYFAHPQFIAAFEHIGLPDWFRFELGIGKIIGAIILLAPIASAQLKEWAYVSFAIVYISGAIAHAVVDKNAAILAPLVPLVFLVISYKAFHKLKVQTIITEK
jgi:hypothetical protein